MEPRLSDSKRHWSNIIVGPAPPTITQWTTILLTKPVLHGLYQAIDRPAMRLLKRRRAFASAPTCAWFFRSELSAVSRGQQCRELQGGLELFPKDQMLAWEELCWLLKRGQDRSIAFVPMRFETVYGIVNEGSRIEKQRETTAGNAQLQWPAAIGRDSVFTPQ